MSRLGLWPAGTSVVASSVHADNYANQCSCNRTYNAFNVLDGDNSTFWNDDTSYVWPDTISLAVSSGAEVNLTGLSIVSVTDGYIIDFDVKVLHDESWTTTHQIRSANQPVTNLRFSDTSIANANGVVENVGGVSISVLNSQDEYSRIAEIRPSYDTSSKSTSSASSSNSASSTSSAKATATQVDGSASTAIAISPATSGSAVDSHSNEGLIIGLAVAMAIIVMLLAGAAFWFIKRRQKQRRSGILDAMPAAITYEKPENKQPVLITQKEVGSPAPAYKPAHYAPEPLWEMPAGDADTPQQRKLAGMSPQELPGH